MFDILRLRMAHGQQAIGDIRSATPPEGFRGLPRIDTDAHARCLSRSGENDGELESCSCSQVCPTGAISLSPFSIDLGACIFCGECARACPEGAITFSDDPRLAAVSRENLLIAAGESADDYHLRAMATGDRLRSAVLRKFRHSLRLRQVSAGGCNGCEMELNATGNVNFDLGRFGVEFVASPRHADGIVITGPVTRNMAPALKDTYDAIPEPKIVIAFGACTISGGLFADSPQLDRTFLTAIPVDLYVPGCPPHPLTFMRALLELLEST